MSQVYLINASLIKPDFSNDLMEDHFSPSFKLKDSQELDPDMAFCKSLRDNGIFMFVSNLDDYGHLVNRDTYDVTRKHPDFYEIYANQKDWQAKYIHENYSKLLDDEFQIEKACPDVYWFPVVTPTYCKHLIEIMENFGQWSNGQNYVRLEYILL